MKTIEVKIKELPARVVAIDDNGREKEYVMLPAKNKHGIVINSNPSDLKRQRYGRRRR